MRLFSPLSALRWLIIPLGACGFLCWSNFVRIQRVDYVTHTDYENAVVDAASPTGYAAGKRWLIVPEHNNRSYQWITETQQMLAQHEWRVRQVDYDNAPHGREVHAASPYRWWLGLLAWCDHSFSDRPLGLSVERAALFADPLLHFLLLVGTTLFVARFFGSFPAALLAVGLVTLYPFASGFLPGAPDAHGLAWACSLWSMLPLLAAAKRVEPLTAANKNAPTTHSDGGTARQTHAFFLLAGIAGGLGLWIDAATQIPVLAGIALGGIFSSWITSGGNPTKPLEIAPWRTWALGGAATCLAAYFMEYFPAHLNFEPQANHPLIGLAWAGVGELLALTTTWFSQRKITWTRRPVSSLIFATIAIAALPVAITLSESSAWLTGDQLATRLSFLPNSAVAKNFLAWVARDGLNGPITATCLPLLLLGPVLWLLLNRHAETGRRARTALALGPVIVALGLATFRLRYWNLCDTLLLALLVTVTATLSSRARWGWIVLAGLIFLPGLIQLWPAAGSRETIEFTRQEVEGLIERSLAHWITDHADPGGAVILLPPDRTTSWCFHGGLRGLGSANWENRDGLQATVRIITAKTATDALELIQGRGVTHIILPSWDSDLDQFARWTFSNPEDAFISAIHHWALPPWLQPLPYQLPANVGFDGQSVVILKVIDETNRGAALARLAEYFVESQQIEWATSTGQSLQLYPTDLSALAALAQVEKANGDAVGFTKSFATLLASLAAGSDRALAWDRRVSLAIILAQGERQDLSREQVRRCLEKVNPTRLRSLTTGSLFRLQVLAKTFGLPIADPALHELAGKLLPPALRARL